MYAHWQERTERVILELTVEDAEDLLLHLWTAGEKHSFLYTEVARILKEVRNVDPA